MSDDECANPDCGHQRDDHADGGNCRREKRGREGTCGDGCCVYPCECSGYVEAETP